MRNSLTLLLSFILFTSIGKAQVLLEELPQLDPFITSYLFSSSDPKGGNSDGYLSGNYLYKVSQGSINNPDFTGSNSEKEYAMVDIKGKGVLNRFWNARYDRSDIIRIYIDGSRTPLIELTIDELFYQKSPPFDNILTFDYSENTGALLTYQPFFFNSSLIVTINNPIGYYQLNVDLFSGEMPSETAQQHHLEELIELFQASGNRPPNSQKNVAWDSVMVNLQSGSNLEIFNKQGSHIIKAIEIKIPSIESKNSTALICEPFRAFSGRSKFSMNVNQSATSFKIRARQLNRFGKRQARVSINGQNKGNWNISEPNFLDYVWQDVEFEISNTGNINSDNIDIEIKAINSVWGDFTYWMICDGVVTDSFNVGDDDDENLHGYSNVNQILKDEMCGRYTFDEAVSQTNSNILKNTIIQANWDGKNAFQLPLSYFCLLGEKDAKITNAVAAGFTGEVLYNYFPMPFSERGTLNLENKSSIDLNNIEIRIAYSTEALESYGHFYAQQGSALAGTEGTDLSILNEDGQGKLVAFVLNAEGPSLDWLEGDERIYIDGANTPSYNGTGTEDHFSGGDYFFLGERDLPLGSLSYNEKNYYNMHRSYISDPINFRDGIEFNLEHGPDSDAAANYNWSVFYYLNSDDSPYIDQCKFGFGEGEANLYNYVQEGGSYFRKSGYYEGSYDNVEVVNKGYRLVKKSQFEIEIPEFNNGIVLERGLHYEDENQCANVFVNDSLVGEWCTMGKNEYKIWKDDFFIIPPAFTKGDSQIKISFESAKENWSEMYYQINVLRDPEIPLSESTTQQSESLISELFPNPIEDVSLFVINNYSNYEYAIRISDINGNIVRVYEHQNCDKVEIEKASLSKGLYLLSVYQQPNNKLLGTIKLIVQ